MEKERSLPFFGMLMVVLIQVGNLEVSKAAMSAGVNKYVLAVYSNVLSTLIFFPLSFICGRSQRPPVTFSILCRIFFLAIIGYSGQISEYAGVQYSSPTLGTAMLNLIPAFTFILAVIFRMEKLEWRSSSSQAKLLGTVVSVAGASLVTLYKGPPVLIRPSVSDPSDQVLLLSPQSSWVLGGILLMGDSLSYSAWYIVQASILKMYPAVLSILFYMFLYFTILSAAFTMTIVRDPGAWTLRLDMGLVAILYTGIVSSVLRGSLSTWCLSKTGPLFCSMFKPLAIIFAVVMDVLFLGDTLYLGSLIGAAITVVGFYAVMWGKANEEKMNKDNTVISSGSSREKIPLLLNRKEEM